MWFWNFAAAAAAHAIDRFPIKRLHAVARRNEVGQATAEYALVLLGVAAVALLVVSWATHTNKIGDLFNGIFDTLLGHVKA
jgi:Flp pilus assembly pilin Flp